MPVHDELGKRMKEFYEQIPKTRLMRRTPVAIRLDGKAFHTFTRRFARPFDDTFQSAMQLTMERLCEKIQGCVFGYQQSDEITLILTDYRTFTTEAWFNYEVQKMCSVAASMATMYFNQIFSHFTDEEEFNDVHIAHMDAIAEGAMFDARVFNIPKEEVANLIYWRQIDAERNSIQSCGQHYFSPKELHGKSCKQIQDMLMTEHQFNWNELPVYQKRGAACYKKAIPYYANDESGWIHIWHVDLEMPRIINEGREYVEKWIKEGE